MKNNNFYKLTLILIVHLISFNTVNAEHFNLMLQKLKFLIKEIYIKVLNVELLQPKMV